MPTYEYTCAACGHEFERFESITAKPNKLCPKCGKKKGERRISAGGGFLFKGSGFYITDYKKTGSKPADGKPAEGKPAETKAGTEPAKSGDSKSTDSKPASTESKPSGDSGGGSSGGGGDKKGSKGGSKPKVA